MSRGGLKPATRTRKQIERAERARDAARLKRSGLGYVKIAEELQCSVGLAFSLVHEGIDSYLAEAKEETAAWIDAAIAELTKVAEEAWREWARSKHDRQRKTTKKTADGTETTKMTEGRLGDPRYLERIESCLEKIGKLRGVFDLDTIDEDETTFEEYQGMMESSFDPPPSETESIEANASDPNQ